MFNENLKRIRKNKGLSQEELATQLNVVRQTISKWEKGLSVPDADMLIRIAELFEISVSELVGEKLDNRADTNDITEQLSSIGDIVKVKSHILYILGSIIGFLVFAFSMFFVESIPVLGAVGIFGMWGMMYCIMKLH